MKKLLSLSLIIFCFSLVSGLSTSLAFVSPAHYEKIKQEKGTKKKTTQAPKLINQTQVVQSIQKSNTPNKDESINQ